MSTRFSPRASSATVGDEKEIWHKGSLSPVDARTSNTRIADAYAEKARDTTLDEK